MNFSQAVGAFILGQLLMDELPVVASEGYDTPTLHVLAHSKGSSAERIRKLFLKAVDENGIAIPSAEIAALSAARRVANEVIEGRLALYIGAKRIWDEIYTRFPRINQLRVFVGLANEFEDDESHRSEYSQMIIDECKNLLASAACGN